MPSVVFYISGHGFGHAVRQIEIINALGAAAPELNLIARTSAPQWLFDRTACVPVTVHAAECDTGVVQIDSLRLDEQATIARAAEFYRTLPQRAADEAASLRDVDARLVISDAPPLACAAASAAGVPSVVVANFTWDWIYEKYREHLSDTPELIPAVSGAYQKAVEGWRLPMHGGFETIAPVRDVPFVARHARHDPEDVRQRLDLPMVRPLVLSSFGGYDVGGLDVSTLDCLDDYAIVITDRDGAPAAELPGVHRLSESRLYGSGLKYEDLVGAVDVVVTKPGYGIISECVANGTAILYTSRGRFAEYDVLVSEMPRYLRCAFLDRDDLLRGRWRAALERLDSSVTPPDRPLTNGAVVIADLILEYCQNQR